MKARRATDRDADAIMVLYRDLVGDAPVADVSQILTVLAHPGTSIWVAESHGELVAMATLHVLPNVTQGGRPYALIENVVTRANRRGAGIGRLLMETVIDTAWAENVYKIMLLTGRTASAKGFYTKLGFSDQEKWAMTLRRAPVRDDGR